MREKERKKTLTLLGEMRYGLKSSISLSCRRGEKEENNISTSPLEDYNLFSRLSDNLYSSNTNNAASDKSGGVGERPHCAATANMDLDT